MELSLTTRTTATYTVLDVGGEIDVYTAPRLREHLIDMIGSGTRQIVVDLSKVDFLDSTGLGVLVGAHRRLRAVDGSLVVVCPQQRLAKIFRITGLDFVLDIRESVAAVTGDHDC